MNAVLSRVCISVIALWVKKWKNKTHMNDVSSIYSQNVSCLTNVGAVDTTPILA